MSQFSPFDRSQLNLRPLSERTHDFTLDDVLALDIPIPEFDHPGLKTVANRIAAARRKDRAVILMMGAHVTKVGLS